MQHLTRRQFVKGSVAAGLGLAVAGPTARVRGANDDIRVAVIGIHGRGGSHIKAFEEIDGVRVVALCDVDEKVLNSKADAFEKKYGRKVAKYVDLRKLLDSKDIDAVSIATTNHWHSLATFWACQAGKDVYVEKPCSHNVFEGRQCVKAARKYNRIVQHGTQSRSSRSWAHAIAAAQSGKYGKLLVSKGYCCKPRWSIGFKPYADVPENLHFDLWLGPAPEQPYHANLVHYNWHWFWDFGNGDAGNQGVHQMDIARWAIPGAGLPMSVVTMGGRWVNGPNFKDQAETPNMELSVFDYGDMLLVFETRGLVGDNAPGFPRRVDNEFYCEEGVIRGGKFYPGGKGDGQPLVDVDSHRYPGNIFENFINCVRSRKRAEQHADILEGHLSSALCHLGNISYRMGWQYPFTMETKALGTGDVVRDSMMTVLANTKAIGVDPEKATYTLGPKLFIDPDKEQFIDNAPANLMLSRFYREPFVVTEDV